MKTMKMSMEKMTSASAAEKVTVVSYEAVLLTVQSRKLYIISEKLILPAAQKLCNIMIVEAAAMEVSTVPLSNDKTSNLGKQLICVN